MKNTIVTNYKNFLLLFFLVGLFFVCQCEDDEDYQSSSIAPMVKKEQDALYSAIQGFVGKWWNGSDLYPDPCGWTPIQVSSYNTFTSISFLFHLFYYIWCMLLPLVKLSIHIFFLFYRIFFLFFIIN